jgi:ABC-type uncharacterized transport system permease subunit
LYIIAGAAFVMTRVERLAPQWKMMLALALLTNVTGLLWHGWALYFLVLQQGGLSLSIGNTASFIGLQLALISFLAAGESTLRGLCGGLVILAALMSLMTDTAPSIDAAGQLSLQLQVHVLISLFAYGLLTVGAIVALFALVQETRLRAGLFSPINQIFAPLETTERLLFGITSAGFLFLLVAVSSGFAFVDNLFSQHLVHKTALSLLALALFGLLLAGRRFAGWRGKRAVYLYLWGFLILCLAYFGSRYVLEEILGRSWS